MKRTGVTVILSGGTRVRFPKCNWIKPETDLTGHIIRTRLSIDESGKKFLGYAPENSVIQAHWNE